MGFEPEAESLKMFEIPTVNHDSISKTLMKSSLVAGLFVVGTVGLLQYVAMQKRAAQPERPKEFVIASATGLLSEASKPAVEKKKQAKPVVIKKKSLDNDLERALSRAYSSHHSLSDKGSLFYPRSMHTIAEEFCLVTASKKNSKSGFDKAQKKELIMMLNLVAQSCHAKGFNQSILRSLDSIKEDGYKPADLKNMSKRISKELKRLKMEKGPVSKAAKKAAKKVAKAAQKKQDAKIVQKKAVAVKATQKEQVVKAVPKKQVAKAVQKKQTAKAVPPLMKKAPQASAKGDSPLSKPGPTLLGGNGVKTEPLMKGTTI